MNNIPNKQSSKDEETAGNHQTIDQKVSIRIQILCWHGFRVKSSFSKLDNSYKES
jgi:hypothetical protein